MKKIILAFALLIAMFSLAQSQTIYYYGGSDMAPTNLFNTIDVISIPTWSPWTNATDSTNKKYSSVINIAKYDSISCFFYGTTTRGVTDLKTVLLLSFDGSNFNTNDTTRVLCDTIVGKSTVLAQFSNATSGSPWVSTAGATMGKLALTPTVSTGVSTTYCNHSNDILNYFLVCHRRKN